MKTLSVFIKNQIAITLLLVGGLTSIIWAAYFAIVTIAMPYQIEYREGAAQVLTGFFLRRENPYILESQPLAVNNYGLGYNLVVTPIAALFGNTLLVHRSITFLFVLLSAGLVFFVFYKKGKDISIGLICSVFILIGLIARGGIGAFPSAFGTFLFLAALLIPFLKSFEHTSLVLSLLLSLMAFYTKPYFLLAFGILFSYLYLFVSKKKGVAYGLIFFILLAISSLLINSIFPLYFVNIVVSNLSNTIASYANVTNQLKDLFFLFYPVLSLLLISILIRANERRSSWISSPLFLNFSKWDAPFVNHSFNYLFYSFACSFLAFSLILGPHQGNYLNYAYQLLVPTFFCWSFHEFHPSGKLKPIFALVVLFNLYVWQMQDLNPEMLKQKDSREWAQVFEYIHSSTLILNSPAVVSELVALGQTPVDSGQTSYFYLVKPFSESLLVNIPYDKFHRDGIRYVSLIDQRIEKQKFDLLILTKEKATFFHSKRLSDYYVKVDEIKLEMPQTYQTWTMVVWVPLDD